MTWNNGFQDPEHQKTKDNNIWETGKEWVGSHNWRVSGTHHREGASRVQQAPWLRKGAKSLGRSRQPEFLGQKTREKTAHRELWTSVQCMCVKKLPKAGKEPPRRIRGDGAHTGPGTVPVPRSQPGKPQDSGDTGKNREKDLASV